ncbi:MAG: DEAD/DEAH box helicase family protein [Methanomassiliicoccaceae archaeon]|nr:DEAD/DEAH box helicase family protein [Methanomassiliicoccaceae archaeon]
MELKKYQKNVLDDLSGYLEYLASSHGLTEAFRKHWEGKNIRVGYGGLPEYNDSIRGVPHVCFKVPTGGGKTFLACASVKVIFDTLPEMRSKIVVWLVPSNTILDQTITNLKNPDHPYRQRLEKDFSGRVEVFTKEELLTGQNFNPSSVLDQLSICVLSFDSLRSNKKDGRKMYQENSSNQQFEKNYSQPDSLIKDVDPTATMQVLNQLSPVVIVDESHNARSELSVEMLNNLNPSFILDLTATPRKNSNIISYTSASDLKKENMVKLPVIVYNRNDKQDVLTDAIMLRGRIEQQAKTEEKATGKYIRPIILFQAQPRSKDDNETFDKLKKSLIEAGIPPEEIAIKTADINEIKDIDLKDRNCKIRYIITVNALKEGWDCPFAYILATLANKTSSVDVEQILGRILRQPYATQHTQPLLNMSYVLTCSNDFHATLDNIIVGLNAAGFSKRDFRIGSNESTGTLFFEPSDRQRAERDTEAEADLSFDTDIVREALQKSGRPIDESDKIDEMTKAAIEQGETFDKELSKSPDRVSPDLTGHMNTYEMEIEFASEASMLLIPRFHLKTESGLFTDGDTTLLSKELLLKGFTLKNKDTSVNFETVDSEIYKVDASGGADSSPKFERLGQTDKQMFKGYFSDYVEHSDTRLADCKKEVFRHLDKRMDPVSSPDLRAYSDKVIENNVKKDDLSALLNAPHAYASKIKEKIDQMMLEYKMEQFDKMIRTGEITCKPAYGFPKRIHPLHTGSPVSKSLYSSESDMNALEQKTIMQVSSLENVKWWHRILERSEGSFFLNGFINHYPDFVIMTKKGNLILLETKGEDRDNTDSRRKLKLGRDWERKAGEEYRYFMVAEKESFGIEGVITIEKLMETIQKL